MTPSTQAESHQYKDFNARDEYILSLEICVLSS